MADVRNTFRSRIVGMMLLASMMGSQVAMPLAAFAEEVPPSQDTPAQTVAPEAPQETTVVTGDAVAETSVENSANTNVTTTDSAASTQDPITVITSGTTTALSATTTDGAATTTSASSQTESASTVASSTSDTIRGEVSVTGENAATTTQAVDLAATTGGNAASGSATTTILTGDATANANVINVINTNIVDSSGILILLSRLFGGTLDLTSAFLNAFSGSTGESCSLEGCSQSGTKYTVTTSNAASITNDVVVRASTGGNTATSTGGLAGIATGDASASANIVNLANTNIVQSNYLLVSINMPGDMNGNIILPGKDFFAGLVSGALSMIPGNPLAINNTNTAEITNTVSATAETGGNTASSTDSTIATGNAQTGVNIVNDVNANHVGGRRVFILFRVYGNWTGNVFGLPDGLSWAETDNGIQIYSADNSGSVLGSPTNISNTNTASITNNVQVLALTGENKVSGESGGISTGDAKAGANIINVVNTNIVGENWIFAIFNIMGDWKGSVSFGQSDLWIGAAASPPAHPGPGSVVPFTFTVKNFGNQDAHHVKLSLTHNTNHISFSDASSTNSGVWWDIGTVAAGQTVAVTKTGVIAAGIPQGTTPIPVTSDVSAAEPDADQSNNSDKLTLVAEKDITIGNSHPVYTPDADFVISKVASKPSATPGEPIEYTITLKNNGGPAFHAQLFDTLRDPKGTVINQETWWLDTINAGESITVSYTMTFSSSTPSGIYTNTAELKATTRNPMMSPFFGVFINPTAASSTIAVSTPVSASSEVCVPFLNSYIGDKLVNEPIEVRKLQMFLRDYEHVNGVVLSGVYDTTTRAAVMAFQTKYADEVLKPWGETAPTGYVYYTTQKKINELYCDGREFPLTEKQMSEMNSHRWVERVQRVTGQRLPVQSGPVGKAPVKKPVLAETPVTKPETASQTAAAAGAGASFKILDILKAWISLKTTQTNTAQ